MKAPKRDSRKRTHKASPSRLLALKARATRQIPQPLPCGKRGSVVALKGRDRYGIFLNTYPKDGAVRVALPMGTSGTYRLRQYNLILRSTEVTRCKDQRKGIALLPKGFKGMVLSGGGK